MKVKRIATIHKKPKEGLYDRPETVAAEGHDRAKGLIGRQHAKETQSRWLTMDVKDPQEQQRLAGEPVTWLRGKAQER